jgi:hypothetical protein
MKKVAELFSQECSCLVFRSPQKPNITDFDFPEKLRTIVYLTTPIYYVVCLKSQLHFFTDGKVNRIEKVIHAFENAEIGLLLRQRKCFTSCNYLAAETKH